MFSFYLSVRIKFAQNNLFNALKKYVLSTIVHINSSSIVETIWLEYLL